MIFTPENRRIAGLPPMLETLKHNGLSVGLISNCFSEEVDVIRNSVLYPYFDAALLSFEQGIQKPDAEIFHRCMAYLGVEAQACLYVGDGGSSELEAASALGMRTVQAVWYLKGGAGQAEKRKTGYPHAETPLEILKYCF
ncbi:MAG: HAD family hydrolase [Hominenteromicrobium sp.]